MLQSDRIMASEGGPMRVGNVEIHCVSDGMISLDGGTFFGSVPKPVWSRRCQTDEQNRIRVAMNSYLIISQGSRILVDTGLGTKLSAREQGFWGLARDGTVTDNLSRLGVLPEDIDVVATTTSLPHPGGGKPTFRL